MKAYQLFFLAEVGNVRVVVTSLSTVVVSWDMYSGVVDLESVDYRVVGYTVFYSLTGNRRRQDEDDPIFIPEDSISVPAPDTSVVIRELIDFFEYQFEVAVTIEVDGDVGMGQRSGVVYSILQDGDIVTTTGELTAKIGGNKSGECLCALNYAS